MRRHVRPFEPRDADAVAGLYASFMAELFGEKNAMTADMLLHDGCGNCFSMVVAVDREYGPIGFAAWLWDYDLHNAVRGVTVPDLYVAPAHRGHALALRLVAGVAHEARAQGAVYVRADVLQDDNKRLKLVRRLAVGFPNESIYLSGHAFREFSVLANADLKTLAANLPTPEASREP
jgi:GNAT superfamily N-acetyltransferase